MHCSSTQKDHLGRAESRSQHVIHLLGTGTTMSRELVSALARTSGLEVTESPLPTRLDKHAGNTWCIVGIPNPFREEDLNRVREARESSTLIAVYADDASSLNLGRRCEVLLAGAPRLLDSSAPGFEEELIQVIEQAVKQQDAILQQEYQTIKLMNDLAIVGRSPVMLDVFRLAQRISHFSDLPVLITGETGTGKELLAQAIYKQDERRCHGPFVPLNCAALSRELSDSELFGHRKGSFTGAGQDRPGLFRSAHRGVLFLDEIGELDLCLQAKLLRVLQENSVLGVGEDRETRVDVRVLAATHRDLGKMVADGSFREDLYHRLNVVLLAIPPLRERPADIAALIEHFLRKHGHLSAGGTATVAPSFVEALQQAVLPGNARQLENLVRRTLIHSDGLHALTVNDLPSELWQEISLKCVTPRPEASPLPKREENVPSSNFIEELLRRHNSGLGECVCEFEDMLVRAVLAKCKGNQAHAARVLGITPRSMYNKLRKAVPAAPLRNGASA